jgi:hypothetical protein
MDQGVALAFATTVATLVYLGLAIANLRAGRAGVALARVFAALLLGGVTCYLAVVELKLF